MNEERIPASDVLMQRLLAHAQPPWEGKALRRAETASARFGLTLPPEALARLGEERRRVLRETRRLELGEGILPRLIDAFCDSPNLHQADYAGTLEALQTIFYRWKNEAGDLTPDEDILRFLRRAFDRAGGSTDCLEGFSLGELAKRMREERDED